MNIFMKFVSVYVLQCMSSKFLIFGSLCLTNNTRKIRDLGDSDYFLVHQYMTPRIYILFLKM